MFKPMLPVICLALVSLAAYADISDKKEGDGKGGSQPAGQFKATAVNLEDFIGRCQNPDAYEQVTPKNIEITCADEYTAWEAAEPGQVPLENARLITSSLTSHKWVVNDHAQAYAVESTPASCMRFKQVK